MCECVCVCTFLLDVSIVSFRKQTLFPNLQISANSILPRRKEIAYCNSFEANFLGCQKRVFIAVRDLIYLQKHILLLAIKSGPFFEIG